MGETYLKFENIFLWISYQPSRAKVLLKVRLCNHNNRKQNISADIVCKKIWAPLVGISKPISFSDVRKRVAFFRRCGHAPNFRRRQTVIELHETLLRPARFAGKNSIVVRGAGSFNKQPIPPPLTKSGFEATPVSKRLFPSQSGLINTLRSIVGGKRAQTIRSRLQRRENRS